MEPVTALYIGVTIAIAVGTVIGMVVIPHLIYKAVQTDEGCEPIWSHDIDTINRLASEILESPEYRERLSNQTRIQRPLSPLEEELHLDLRDIDDDPMEYYEMPLPADPRATVELSPIEQEMREAEEYARLHNPKTKVDEAIDNIKL